MNADQVLSIQLRKALEYNAAVVAYASLVSGKELDDKQKRKVAKVYEEYAKTYQQDLNKAMDSLNE